MSHSNLARLRGIKTLPQLAAYLRDELDWPIESDDADEITFEYSAAELGLDEKSAVNIREIKQLRPLAGNQPWGIFFVNFEKKRLPVVAMRRILRALVFKKRASANKAERQAWHPHDLLFISAYGEESDRAITFAHFVDRPDIALAELRVLGWDDDDTPLHADYVVQTLQEKLRWDAKVAANPKLWREQWASAFLIRHGHVIRTSEELAEALAMLARRLRGRIRTILRMEAGDGQIRTLQRAFQIGLIHDLDDDGFADMFAQTVTYGLFSVSVRRTFPGIGTAVTKDDVPNLIFTSPFLKDMLGVFLGIKSYKGEIDFDELGVSDVTDLLTSPDTHMEVVLADFNNKTRGEDPVIHFYEHFLTAYNKELKVQRGVFYTPQPVVSYIVRSVHELLQTEFGLEDGLADTTTWGEMLKKYRGLILPPLTDEPGEKRTISPDEPFVQILDPATGTATFLVEVIDVIHHTLKAKWKAQRLNEAQQRTAWNDYVPTHLLSRLHAFELMMAPYAIAHMKIGLKLAETGYLFGTEERARIYLTNALEPKVSQLPQIGFEALAQEAAAVNEIKWYKRFTVVIGNPPYSGHSSNTGTWISQLVRDYYIVDRAPLREKNTKWLQDDYVKFTRLGQGTIATSGVGIFSYITNHGYVDNPTFRGMRQNLLNTFQKLFILDLHGNSNKQETSPDGAKDVNVFEIQQGVAILAGVRMPTRHSVRAHGDLYGAREKKYAYLSGHTIQKTPLSQVSPASPFYYFMPQDASLLDEYQHYVGIQQMFGKTLLGPNSHRDEFAISFDRATACERLADLADRSMSDAEVRRKYSLVDNRDWSLKAARKYDFRNEKPVCCLYRPFDFRWMLYGPYAFDYHRPEINDSLLKRNLALISTRQTKERFAVFVTACPAGQHKLATPYDGSYLSPLYLFQRESDLDLEGGKQSNLDPRFLATFHRVLGDGLTPEGIFHYAYAVFNSPGYRSRFAEFLKIDFPRLPLTTNIELFGALARLGGELVALHIMESPSLAKSITEFVGGRSPTVEKITWSKSTVWIDKAQTTGFQGVKEEVWNFHIGGYQVCEKWLKDRKDRKLLKEEIEHYQRTIVALSETIRLMAEVDKVISDHGGWPRAFAIDASISGSAPESAPSVPIATAPDLGLHTEDELPLG
jgi:hypothetical protein